MNLLKRRVETCQVCLEDFEWIPLLLNQEEDKDKDKDKVKDKDKNKDKDKDKDKDKKHWSGLKSIKFSLPSWWPRKKNETRNEANLSFPHPALPISPNSVTSRLDPVAAPPPPSPLVLGFTLPCGPNHLFCSSCLETHINTQLQSLVWPVMCPQHKCQEAIPAVLVESLLGRNAERWHVLGAMRAVTRQIFCPNDACNAMIDGDYSGSEKEIKEDDALLVDTMCPYCKHGFCALCLENPHQGKTCEQAGSESEWKNAFDELATKSRWKKCPACGHMVAKSGGCNFMTCFCGRSFCYVCNITRGSCTHLGRHHL